MPRHSTYDAYDIQSNAHHSITRPLRSQPYNPNPYLLRGAHDTNLNSTRAGSESRHRTLYGRNKDMVTYDQQTAKRPSLKLNTSIMQGPHKIISSNNAGIHVQAKTRRSVHRSATAAELYQTSEPTASATRLITRRHTQTSHDMCILSPITFSESRPDIGELYERSRSTISPKKWSPLSPLSTGLNNSPLYESNTKFYHDVWASPNTTSFAINASSSRSRSSSPTEYKSRTSKVPLDAPGAPRMRIVQLPSPTDVENDQHLAKPRMLYSLVKPRRVSGSTLYESAA